MIIDYWLIFNDKWIVTNKKENNEKEYIKREK